MDIKKGNLVLYKNTPACVLSVGDKIEIELLDNTFKKVRLKDVEVLHEGPLNTLNSLKKLRTDLSRINDARELILDEPVSLEMLAELIFDENTPSAVWTAWNIFNEGIYFSGKHDCIEAKTDEEIREILEKQELKAREEEERKLLIERLKSNSYLPEDVKYLKEIEQLAFGYISKSRLMYDLKIEQTPEKAHSLLLKTGFWDFNVNPYPVRSNILPDTMPIPEIPDLPEEDRLDLTYLDSYAIDDEGCTDPDDALSMEGDFLWVHIADAAAIVKPDSDLDKFALGRGTNLYIPEAVVMMLPEKITHILGLGLNDISPALSFKLKLDTETGNIVLDKMVPSWVKVKMLSYEDADRLIDTEPFNSIYKLTQTFRNRRLANGAVELKLPEVKIKKTDESINIKPIVSLPAREMVTDAMLMVGESLAEFALKNDIALPFAAQSIDDAIEISEDLAGMFAARKKLKPAVIMTEAGAHAGLGLDHYTRATSPLRRYLDLVVHQQMRAFLQNEDLMDQEQIDRKISLVRDLVSEKTAVERNSNRHWKLVYMDNENWEGEAVLVDKFDTKGTFTIPDMAFETRLSIDKTTDLNTKVKLKFNGYELSTLTGYFTLE